MQQLIAKGRTPDFPKMSCGYLVDILFEIGPVSAGAMGPVQISELEILAWQVNRRFFLQPWEVKFLRRLSAEYLAMSASAEWADCIAPYRRDGGVTPAEAAAVTEDMRAHLRRMAG